MLRNSLRSLARRPGKPAVFLIRKAMLSDIMYPISGYL